MGVDGGGKKDVDDTFTFICRVEELYMVVEEAIAHALVSSLVFSVDNKGADKRDDVAVDADFQVIRARIIYIV